MTDGEINIGTDIEWQRQTDKEKYGNSSKEKEKERKKESNKAGYTANTSRGRVGRGENAHFHTFNLDHHGPTDGRTDRQSLL